jgi:NCS1 nucleoside transporter family
MATEVADEYAAFKVEQRGIELIPEDERPMRPANLFWLWAGAIWNVEYLVYGALIMSFGLSFGQAVLAILLGNIAYVFLGLASLQGPQTGTTAFMVSRAPFGPNGNRLPSFFNWITQVGFEVEGLVLIVLVVLAMFTRGGIHAGPGLKVAIILGAVGLQFIVPFLGHPTITRVLKYLSVVFIAVFAVMAALVVPHVNLNDLAAYRRSTHTTVSVPWQVVTTAVVLIVSAGGLGWTENANDYSRYLPRTTPKVRTFWAAALGAAIPSILLELLGAAAFVVSPAATTVTAVPSAFTSWFFWPFMILVLPQLFAINTLDLYSSGVTLQSLGAPVSRWGAVLIDTLIAGAATAAVVFHGDFLKYLGAFLNYIVVWLAPWFGILITDWLLRRRRYDRLALATEGSGVYWRKWGLHWRALVALVVGGVAAFLWVNAQFDQPLDYLSPLSRASRGADFSWAIGTVVGALVYLALSFRAVPAEVASTVPSQAA